MSDLIERLHKQAGGGCTCMTKTPELKFHDVDCTYRVTTEAASEIERLTAESKAKDVAYETMQEYVTELEARVEELEADKATLLCAMNSIANNRCCENCQEAKLVAVDAINKLAEQGEKDGH